MIKIWFLEDLQRLQYERDEIDELLSTAEWLQSASWNFMEGQLVVNAILRVHDNEYEVVLVFPALFPEVPAFVRPVSETEIWSEHQYRNGTFCLEWGPDTWHPSVTGAQLLESTFRLLDIENPHGSAAVKEKAPSRHQLSLGQELRFRFSRVFLTKGLQDRLSNLPQGKLVPLDFTFFAHKNSFVLIPFMLRFESDEHWTESTIPSALTSQNKYSGMFYASNLDAQFLNNIPDIHALKSVLGSETNAIVDQLLQASKIALFIIQSVKSELYSYLSFSSDNGNCDLYSASVIMSEEDFLFTRLPPQYEQISTKTVGIVGLGSVGSKVALHLARSGVKTFIFIDDDIFLPGNIVRHALDWRNVGEHKVQALKTELDHIANEMSVTASEFRIGGQESSSALSQKLSQLGQCDLIIDATANTGAFNMLAAVAKYYEKPMVWVEIFAGGIGGFIGRSRPGIDPDVHSMRRIYHAYTAEHPSLEIPRAVANYTGVIADTTLWQATDADVSVIAAHVARFVLDTLGSNTSSLFPYSMYLIGLQNAWVFTAPFHTIPISTDGYVDIQSDNSEDQQAVAAAIAFLRNLLSEHSDNDSNSSQDS